MSLYAGRPEEGLSAFSPLTHGLLLNPKLGWRSANKSQRLPCLLLLPQHWGYRHNHAQLFVCLLEIQAQVLRLGQQGLLPTDLSPQSLTFDFSALEIPKLKGTVILLVILIKNKNLSFTPKCIIYSAQGENRRTNRILKSRQQSCHKPHHLHPEALAPPPMSVSPPNPHRAALYLLVISCSVFGNFIPNLLSYLFQVELFPLK